MLRRTETGYSTPTIVELEAKGAGDPAISGDEHFLVLDADGLAPGDADLFVICRSTTGWTPASRFADPVSSNAEEGDPSVSPDGHTLYIFSRRLISGGSPGPRPPRPPRAQRATYAEVEHEAVSNIYNGSRNLYSVSLAGFSCGS